MQLHCCTLQLPALCPTVSYKAGSHSGCSRCHSCDLLTAPGCTMPTGMCRAARSSASSLPAMLTAVLLMRYPYCISRVVARQTEVRTRFFWQSGAGVKVRDILDKWLPVHCIVLCSQDLRLCNKKLFLPCSHHLNTLKPATVAAAVYTAGCSQPECLGASCHAHQSTTWRDVL